MSRVKNQRRRLRTRRHDTYLPILGYFLTTAHVMIAPNAAMPMTPRTIPQAGSASACANDDGRTTVVLEVGTDVVYREW